jgi:hypothetical protein
MLMGFRSIRIATSVEYAQQKRVTVWKVFLGSLITYSAIHSHYYPAPNMLKANNAGEEQGMLFATILLTVLGLWLIFLGIKSKLRPSQQT